MSEPASNDDVPDGYAVWEHTFEDGRTTWLWAAMYTPSAEDIESRDEKPMTRAKALVEAQGHIAIVNGALVRCISALQDQVMNLRASRDALLLDLRAVREGDQSICELCASESYGLISAEPREAATRECDQCGFKTGACYMGDKCPNHYDVASCDGRMQEIEAFPAGWNPHFKLSDAWTKSLIAAQTDELVDERFTEIYDIISRFRGGTSTTQGIEYLLAWVAEDGIAARLHVGILLACIRLTGPFRRGLKEWTRARDAMHRALKEREGIDDVDALMCGLLDEPRTT